MTETVRLRNQMLRYLIFFSLCFSPNSDHSGLNILPVPSEVVEVKKTSQLVLICRGPTAYAYHRKYCRGLKQCSKEMVEIDLYQALEMGRKACGFCY